MPLESLLSYTIISQSYKKCIIVLNQLLNWIITKIYWPSRKVTARWLAGILDIFHCLRETQHWHIIYIIYTSNYTHRYYTYIFKGGTIHVLSSVLVLASGNTENTIMDRQMLGEQLWQNNMLKPHTPKTMPLQVQSSHKTKKSVQIIYPLVN